MDWKEFEEWFTAQHVESLGLRDLKGSAEYKRTMLGFVPSSNTMGERRRVNFVRLRYGYPLSAEDYNFVTFHARVGGKATIFACCYIRKDVVEYVCPAPTFDSKDGEYRPRLVTLGAFDRACAKYEKTLSVIEAHILQRLEAGTLALDVRSHPPRDGIADVIDRIGHRALAMCLGIDVLAGRDAPQLHTEETYLTCLREVVRDILTVEIPKTMYLMGAPVMRVSCGQKITPLSMQEMMQPNDLNLAVWRELWARGRVSDLVLNGISAAFPLENQWIYLSDAGPSMFANRAMKLRYNVAAVAAASVSDLRSARAKVESERKESYAMARYDAAIYDAIGAAREYLLLSDVAMCATSEYVGRTLPNRGGTVIVGKLSMKPMFDILYGLMCLQCRAHIVHADLHANNITSMLMAEPKPVRRQIDNEGVSHSSPIIRPVTAYIAGAHGESDTYIFPYTGYQHFIIDFSRCIIGPGAAKEIAEGRPARYTEHFYQDQAGRVLRTLERYASHFVRERQAELKAAILTNFEQVFRALSYVDYIAAGHSFASMYDANNPMFQPVGISRDEMVAYLHKMKEFALRVEKVARDRFITHLHAIVSARGKPVEIPFAGEVLLGELFADYKFARVPPGYSICEVQNFNLPLRWSGRDYSRFPPWARIDEMEKRLGGIKITDLTTREIQPFFDSLLPDPRVEIVAERARAEQEALDSPVDATSSWLN